MLPWHSGGKTLNWREDWLRRFSTDERLTGSLAHWEMIPMNPEFWTAPLIYIYNRRQCRNESSLYLNSVLFFSVYSVLQCWSCFDSQMIHPSGIRCRRAGCQSEVCPQASVKTAASKLNSLTQFVFMMSSHPVQPLIGSSGPAAKKSAPLRSLYLLEQMLFHVWWTKPSDER